MVACQLHQGSYLNHPVGSLRLVFLDLTVYMSKVAKTTNNAVQSSRGRRSFLIKGASTGIVGAMAGIQGASEANAAPAGRRRGRKKRRCKERSRGRSAEQGIHAPMTSDARSTHDLHRRTEICRGYANAAQLADRQETNGDEEGYKQERYYASFTKTLPCNAFGEVEPSAFEALVHAMQGDQRSDFDAIPLAAGASLKLANPQGALKYLSCGPDGQQSRMPASHRFSSAELAGELVEVYWQALTRDVPFADYEEDAVIADAVEDINSLSRIPAGTSNLFASPRTLFRGESYGDLRGPYISQFLWQDYQIGPKRIDQRYPAPSPNIDFMNDLPNWLSVQRGAPQERQSFTRDHRYIFNNRTLAGFVHADAPFQAYLQAALILLGYGPDALAQGTPYLQSSNQGAFVSHGAPFILDLVTRAAQAALHAAWYQKWSVHRFLRPEAMAARVHFRMMDEREYPIHEDLLNSLALEATYSDQGNYLLSQAYPEGSPTHPSYPAGHACIAGACVTILKALFDENYFIHQPVVANRTGTALLPYQHRALHVGGELNKLANNMSLGRDAAGVHYRQDGIQGLQIGEQVAIALLQEQSTSSQETGFEGYKFRNFKDVLVEIRDGKVQGEQDLD